MGHHDVTDIRRNVFLDTGCAIKLLVDAFSKLPNLRSVGIRDYDGNGRTRDGDRAKWRSYGWSLIERNDRTRQSYASPDAMLLTLLFALGEASIRPTNLEAFLRRKRMPDESFDLSCSPTDVTPVLSGLRTLLLSLEDDPEHYPGFDEHNHLKNFLQHTPLLEHLRLNFTNMYVHPFTVTSSQEFLQWFGALSGVASASGPTPISLDHLTTLDLGMLTVTPKILLQVVSKCAKLKALSLWKVNLNPNSQGPNDNADCLWSRYLPEIGKALQAPEDVSSFMIGFAGEAHSGRPSADYADVKFAKRISVDRNGEKKFEEPEGKISYRKRVGSNVHDWLEDLSKRTFREVMESSDDSDDDEDHEDDDGEGDDGDEGDDGEEDEIEVDEDEVIVLS